jgi:hypothetical protein
VGPAAESLSIKLAGGESRPDVDRFAPLLDEALANVRPRRVVADAGYGSEPNHRYARGTHRVLSFKPFAAKPGASRRGPKP